MNSSTKNKLAEETGLANQIKHLLEKPDTINRISSTLRKTVDIVLEMIPTEEREPLVTVNLVDPSTCWRTKLVIILVTSPCSVEIQIPCWPNRQILDFLDNTLTNMEIPGGCRHLNVSISDD